MALGVTTSAMEFLKKTALALAVLATVACDDDKSKVKPDEKPQTAHSAWNPAADPELAAQLAAPEPKAAPQAPPPVVLADGGKVDAAAAAVALASADGIKVIELGAEPRKKLRYKFKVGSVETLQFEQKRVQGAEAGGKKQGEQALPTVKLTLTVEPKKISGDGDAECDVKLTSAEVQIEGAPPDLAAKLKPQLDALKGLSGKVTLNGRGIAKSAVFDGAQRPSSQLGAQTLQQLSEVMKTLLTALPDEAIGKGAKWERSFTGAEAGGGTMKETYTLRELGDKATLDMISLETRPRGEVETGQGSATMDSFKTEAKGTVIIDFARLTPTKEYHSVSNIVLVGQDPTEKATISLKIDSKLSPK